MKESRFRIIDDFLPQAEFKQLQETVLSPHFPWFYIDNVSLKPEDNNVKDELAVETDGLNHVMFDREWNVKSYTFEHIIPFMEALEKNLGFTVNDLVRARLSMKTPKIGFTTDNYNLPHVDYFFPHETLIYYLNDSDGDTRIFNESVMPTAKGAVTIGHETFTTKARVSPKANRLVWINGLQYHTASNPINSPRRVIVNINLDPK